MKFFGLNLLGAVSLLRSVWSEHSDENAIQDHLYSTGEPCNWISSGPHLLEATDVRVGRLWCDAGKVIWKHPNGALLLTFALPSGKPPGYEFCIRPMKGNKGSGIYRKTESQVTPLLRPEDTGRREICFEAGNEVTLFLESAASVVPEHLAITGFHYTFRHLSRDAEEECRPCTEKELLTAYCSAPFVFKGTGATPVVSEDPKYSLWKFIPQKLYRKPLEKQDMLETSSTSNSNAFVHISSQCGAGEVDGIRRSDSFLVIAIEEMGIARMRCAQPWKEWKEIRRKNADSAPCDLFAVPKTLELTGKSRKK